MGLMSVVKTYFEAEEWDVQPVEGYEDSMLRMGFQGDRDRWDCVARVREAEQQVLFYSICGQKVPEGKRLLMAEFLMRANYGLMIGNFEMDFADGEILYKTSIDVEGSELTTQLFQQLVFNNLVVMERYLPGILGVAFGKLTPSEAIAQSEKGLQPA